MIEILKKKNHLVLEYYTEYDYPHWLDKLIEANNSQIKLGGVFKLNTTLFIEKVTDKYDTKPKYFFRIGDLVDEYYQIYREVLELQNDFYIFKELDINSEYFIAESQISILKRIDNNVKENIYIGGELEDVLPAYDFLNLLEVFPKTYEVNLYRDAKITAIIGNYFKSTKDREQQYHTYVNNKTFDFSVPLRKSFKEVEIFKYETILERLERMLNDETSYSENQWQEEILQIILLLFPKYISVFKEVRFKDVYSNKIRRLDYGLIDFMGNLDLVEIKKPFDKNLISRVQYRDNHLPNRDLSGAIMQIEKYIYYLNKLGKIGEKQLTKKYSDQLPENLEIKIVNPRGIIIMGRDNNLYQSQLSDFEIIKRKYRNIVDIFTYDDLIRRLRISVEQLRKI